MPVDFLAAALVRLGECYEKQGNAEARKTYEQVLSRFGDQTEAVAQARADFIVTSPRLADAAAVFDAARRGALGLC